MVGVLPHAKALAELPLVSIEKIGEAAPKPWPKGDRPLAGLRVLDLSRVIAGPVAGRTLAVHGADVLLISGPDLPAIPWLTIDTGRGKLSSCWSNSRASRGGNAFSWSVGAGRYCLAGLSAEIHCRPRLLAGGRRQDQSRHHLSLAVGLWPCRAVGGAPRLRPRWCRRRPVFNHAEGQAAGVEGPKELPAQMLDHATGYLMAFGAMMAKARQSREGGSWHVRVSLAQTGRWLWNLGRVADGLQTEDLKGETVMPFIEEIPSGFGPLRSGQALGRAVKDNRRSGRARQCSSAGHPPQWPALT